MIVDHPQSQPDIEKNRNFLYDNRQFMTYFQIHSIEHQVLAWCAFLGPGKTRMSKNRMSYVRNISVKKSASVKSESKNPPLVKLKLKIMSVIYNSKVWSIFFISCLHDKIHSTILKTNL